LTTEISHLPVLRAKVLEMLNIRQNGIYVDATTGLGGHAEAILREIGSDGRLIGIDRDDEALLSAKKKLSDLRVTLMQGNFSDMATMICANGITAVDGILFDLGLSSMQLKSPGRGFSFASDAPLDMRMDRSQKISARDIVNRYPENQLERIFREFGEERFARKIAKAIIQWREKKPIETCAELSKIVEKIYGMRGKIHPATKTFQALRIAVNQELDQLTKGLHASLQLLKQGGRLCVISYHSLEDRIVKHFIADNAKKGLLRIIVKKPITPAPEELSMNPSSRSAKLRVAEKI
jgi:16S rRNA (cytosine1402-N4)-methyltransferase